MVSVGSVGVFCGSSSGTGERYTEAAQELGALLAEERVSLVYGGGRVGLMGTLADSCLARGGHVVGVIPRWLFRREVAHRGVSELLEPPTLDARKDAVHARA